MYEKNASTIVQATSEEGDEVYEFPVDSPLPFQPGDILGLLQPDMSRLEVRYHDGGDSVYYNISADQSSSMFDISGNNGKMGTPLVTVESKLLCYFKTVVLHILHSPAILKPITEQLAYRPRDWSNCGEFSFSQSHD